MTAIVGAVDNAPFAADRREAVTRAIAALRTRGAQALESSAGRQWAAGGKKENSHADAWHEDRRGFALIQGAPRAPAGSELAAAIRDRGLAAACAAEYERSGTSFLAQLDGPFALVIRLDRDDKTLLAVDKLGVLPLFYAAGTESVSFANQLALLRGLPGLDFEIDPQAIYDYLYFHAIPGPRTVYKRVRRLTPAAYLERVRGRDGAGFYWQARFERERDSVSFEQAKREFVGLLESGVRAELAGSKRVGCFLSGGTDSSTLAGMVTRVGGEPARTYSIGFDQQGFDEIEYARIAVRHFGTRHKEHYVDSRDIVRIVPQLAAIYGQPFGNSSVVPTFCCAEMARADGMETMVGGDGGDELFGGNSRYATQELFSWYESVPGAVRRYLLEPLVRVPGASAVMPLRKLGRYIEQALVPMPDRLQTYNHLKLMGARTLLEDEFVARVDLDDPARAAAAEYHRSNAQTMLNRMLALDWKYTLADNDLPKVTEMCDSAGVGVVFPFLHQDLVEFSARLPAAQKVNKLRLRYFFKKALADFLPPEIITKKKHGFGMPFGDWLVAPGPLRDLAFDSLNRFRGRGIVRAPFIDDLKGPKLAQHANYYGGLIWLLLVLEQWFEWHGDATRPQAGST